MKQFGFIWSQSEIQFRSYDPPQVKVNQSSFAANKNDHNSGIKRLIDFELKPSFYSARTSFWNHVLAN